MSEDRADYTVTAGPPTSTVGPEHPITVPFEVLWQQQRLHVCGECRDCKWWQVREPGSWIHQCGQHSMPEHPFLILDTFGCTEWQAR